MEITEKVRVLNQLGLHLRAAALLVKTSSRFKCRILLKNHHNYADGKSLLNLIVLAATCGSELTVVYEGVDAWDACNAIHDLFVRKFGESE
jgi:phosphocarrier protein